MFREQTSSYESDQVSEKRISPNSIFLNVEENKTVDINLKIESDTLTIFQRDVAR